MEFCSNCKFWVRFSEAENPNFGKCTRFPPKSIFDPTAMIDGSKDGDVYSVWPETMADDMCGEFKEKFLKG